MGCSKGSSAKSGISIEELHLDIFRIKFAGIENRGADRNFVACQRCIGIEGNILFGDFEIGKIALGNLNGGESLQTNRGIVYFIVPGTVGFLRIADKI